MTRTLLHVCLCFCAGSPVLIPGYAEGPSGGKEKGAVSGSQRASLEELSERVEALVRNVSPSVLQIISESFVGHDDDPRGGASTVAKQTGIGTGFLVSPDGDVITNAHVVAGARRVRVRIHEPRAGTAEYRSLGRLMDAKVVGLDRETDLALLKLNGSWKHLHLADSSLVRQGQIVLAVGNPRGLENSVSMGVVSATSRQIHPDASQAYIQTDAPINPGNSGGPLVDTHGDVIGVNTFIVTESGGSEGLGFAIPSNLVRDIYSQLKKYGRVRRGEIGVIVRSMTPELAAALSLKRESGVLIQDVLPDSGAAQAGMQTNDIVTRVQGRSVRNVRQFASSLFQSDLGEPVALNVVRGDSTITVKVPLEDRTDPTEALALQVKESATPVPEVGALLVQLDQSTALLVDKPRYDAGCIVVARLDGTGSFEEDLVAGDLIFGVNGKRAILPNCGDLCENT